MSDPDGPEDVLAERPDLEAPLEAILAVDEEQETWTFEDIPVESGPFGELVGRDVVESVGDEYRLREPAAVEGALSAESQASVDASTRSGPELPSLTVPTVDRTTALFVTAAIAFVGLVRIHPIDAIYRGGDVVLSGNDPYAYRYYVEQFLQGSTVPAGALKSEPLLVWTLGSVSNLLGGIGPAQHVMAWYPVVSALLSAIVVYLLAVRVTRDRRIGVAAVVFLALIPGHAMRTSVGFGDHHAFDYVWLGATALAVTWLADVDREALRAPVTWAVTLALAIAVAGQVLAWEAGPLVTAPIGLIVAGRAALDLRRGVSPLPAGVPVVAGLTSAAVIAFTIHAVTGFQTTIVVLSPLVVAAGGASALGIALACRRLGWGGRRLLIGYALAAIAGLFVLVVVLTPLWTVFSDRLDLLFRSDAIAETGGLFSADSFGFLFLFGLALVLALPAMAIGVWRSITDGRWLAVTAYAWYFFGLAVLQIRFVGELATFAAVFAGYGFVWVAARIDAIAFELPERPPPLRLPNERVLGTLFVLLVLFGGFGALQVGVKTSQLTIEDDVYDSAAFIDDHATERGLEYPENYVLSDWGRNRVLNYFVNGESASYGYAFRNYRDFAGGTDPDGWFEEFDGRVGYIVLATAEDGVNPQSAIWRLTRNFGSASDIARGVGHYRALYVPDGGTRTVVSVVPGANVTGSGEPTTTVTASTVVDTDRLEFVYERRTAIDGNGTWALRLAHPGTYEVTVGNETTEVTVSETAVRQGEQANVGG